MNDFREVLTSLQGKVLKDTTIVVAVGFGSEFVGLSKVLSVGTEIVTVEVAGLDYRDRNLMSYQHIKLESIVKIICPVEV